MLRAALPASSPVLKPFAGPYAATYIRERRRGLSDLEIASLSIAHAVNYLVSEQFARNRDCLKANREAIAILCELGRQLAEQERRGPAYQAIAAWIRPSTKAQER